MAFQYPILSLAALTVLELEPIEQINIAYQAGYQAVGLRLIPATDNEPHTSLINQPERVKAVKKALSESGLSVLDIEILRLKPNTQVRNDYEPVIALGAELGASNVLVAGNDADPIRLRDNLMYLCELSSQYNLYPHLEFMPWTSVPNLHSATAIIGDARKAGCTNACLLIDPFHLNRSNSAIVDLANINPSWMRYAQMCDIAGEIPADMDEILREARTERCAPGDGDIDLISVLLTLPKNLPLSLEVPTENERQSGIPALDRAQAVLTKTKKLLHTVQQ